MRKILVSLIILMTLAGPVFGQGGAGLFIRSDCDLITTPVTGKSWCFDSTNNQLKYWSGGVWTIVTVATTPITAAQGGTGLNTSNTGSTSVPVIVAGVWATQFPLNATFGGSGQGLGTATGVGMWTGGVYSATDARVNTYSYNQLNLLPMNVPGTIVLCTNCHIQTQCVPGSSTGAFAKRNLATWVCN